MRQGQQNRRGRGRTNGGGSNNNGGSNSSNNNNNNHNNGRKPQNPLSRNYESSGPDVKIRGTAAQIAEKYTALARDASAASDVVMVENYLQHAEHYNRIIMAAQAQQPQVPVQQQPSVSSHHVQENGHERGHGNSLPQRISPDANGALRDQPQPVITFEEAPAPVQEVAVEQPEPAAPQPTPRPAPRERAAKDDATREEAPRRRRRRYPAGGTGDRAATGPDDANGAEGAKEVAKSDRPADEAIA